MLYFIGRFFALVRRLQVLLSRSVAALLALSAVLGNLRHPLTRFVLTITAFFTLWCYLELPYWFSLPAVLGVGGVFEKYYPTEVVNSYFSSQEIEPGDL